MADFILIDGDIVNFIPVFGIAAVMVRPGSIRGSGAATIGGKNVCVEGDETSVAEAGCTYVAGAYVVPGAGTLKINSLAPNQTAKKTRSGGKAVLLKGAMFTAKFEVQTPAMMSPESGSVPDSTLVYTGQGMFIAGNTKFKGE